jgi:hypothetical protein
MQSIYTQFDENSLSKTTLQLNILKRDNEFAGFINLLQLLIDNDVVKISFLCRVWLYI